MNQPDFVYQMAGYATSKDYALLAELAKKQAVICLVDYTTQCRDVAHTIWENYPQLGGQCFQISARGTCYVHADTVEEFVSQCQRVHLEFIVPNQVAATVLALPDKPGLWWWQEFGGADWQMVEAVAPEKSAVKNKLIVGAVNRDWFGMELPGWEDKLSGKWVFVNPPLFAP